MKGKQSQRDALGLMRPFATPQREGTDAIPVWIVYDYDYGIQNVRFKPVLHIAPNDLIYKSLCERTRKTTLVNTECSFKRFSMRFAIKRYLIVI